MKIAFAIPGDLSLPTGGYAYARRVLAEWSDSGVAAKVVGLPQAFPHPDAAALTQTEAALADVSAPLLIDGLAYGAFPESLAARIGPRAVALVHHPLCDEHDLTAQEAARMEEVEWRALAHARAVVVTGPATARDLAARFGVPQERITVAVPGTDPAPSAPLEGDPPVILAVGTMTPRKGYDLLVAALAACRAYSWRCEIVGAVDRDTAEAERIRAMIDAAGLSDRIALRGVLADGALADAYQGADLFVAPSRHEGYGMAVAEAMACGLPVVVARAGALPETAPCAAFFDPGDVEGLAETLRRLLGDAADRHALAARCRKHGETLPRWPDTARILADAVRRAF